MEFRHKPILLQEVISYLNIRPDGIYLDGTLGGAGHGSAVCSALGPSGKLIGIDQDEAAVEAAGKRLAPWGDRAVVVRDNYIHFDRVLDGLGIGSVDGILLDLGVSSYQLDEGERGFSYREDAPLDMRMDRRKERTARDVVNGCSREELARIIRDYGEERFAWNIAGQIVAAREKKPVETTGELSELIKAGIPPKFRAGGHPAKQTFQAIRIEVNGELDVLKDSLSRMILRLKPGGRICIITFHSLEDRIVKNCFRDMENPCICPPDFPVCVCGRKPEGRVLTRRPAVPGPAEQEENPRSKSAKLRVFERIVQA